MNAKVTGTTVAQTANELLGKKAQDLYYLIVETGKGKLVINVGEKTYRQVIELTDVTTKLQFEKPEGGAKK